MQTAVRDYPQGELRASDADRDRALGELSEAFQAGRITADEFDQRSGQVLRSRTGSELTAVLADLPKDRPPAARAPGLRLPDVARIRVGALAAAGATALSALAVANALPSRVSGPSAAEIGLKRQLAQEILAREGLKVQIPRGLIANPANPGFDWVGTLMPAAFAVLLVVLIIFLWKTRADRP